MIVAPVILGGIALLLLLYGTKGSSQMGGGGGGGGGSWTEDVSSPAYAPDYDYDEVKDTEKTPEALQEGYKAENIVSNYVSATTNCASMAAAGLGLEAITGKVSDETKQRCMAAAQAMEERMGIADTVAKEVDAEIPYVVNKDTHNAYKNYEEHKDVASAVGLAGTLTKDAFNYLTGGKSQAEKEKDAADKKLFSDNIHGALHQARAQAAEVKKLEEAGWKGDEVEKLATAYKNNAQEISSAFRGMFDFSSLAEIAKEAAAHQEEATVQNEQPPPATKDP